MSGWTPLPWQQERWAQVTATIAAARLGHALLLAGPRGVGKRHFARGIAGYLLCEAPAGAKPCGTCRSCVQREAGVHPNLLRLTPADDRRDIAIDDIRALLERLHLSSHYGQAKVALIEPADALNASGVNALLKTVEEPPRATHVLLVAERWRSLPATLRSRCQILRFAPPPPAVALDWLRGQHPAAREDLLQERLRAPLLSAPEPVDDGGGSAREEWGKALADALAGRPSLRVAQGLRRDAAQAGLEHWLADATARLREGLLAGPGQRAPTEPLLRALDDTIDALRALDRNANPTLLVESIIIRLSQRAAARRPA